mmetsp:Transcript_2801/g.9453  ORF Transcript_2801/g.9453 Transcript_2801/m.9453 type:complete len:330 (+) Transcript_2801:205-1194(+)
MPASQGRPLGGRGPSPVGWCMPSSPSWAPVTSPRQPRCAGSLGGRRRRCLRRSSRGSLGRGRAYRVPTSAPGCRGVGGTPCVVRMPGSPGASRWCRCLGDPGGELLGGEVQITAMAICGDVIALGDAGGGVGVYALPHGERLLSLGRFPPECGSVRWVAAEGGELAAASVGGARSGRGGCPLRFRTGATAPGRRCSRPRAGCCAGPKEGGPRGGGGGGGAGAADPGGNPSAHGEGGAPRGCAAPPSSPPPGWFCGLSPTRPQCSATHACISPFCPPPYPGGSGGVGDRAFVQILCCYAQLGLESPPALSCSGGAGGIAGRLLFPIPRCP